VKSMNLAGVPLIRLTRHRTRLSRGLVFLALAMQHRSCVGPDAHLETPRRKCNDAGPYSPLRTLALKPLPNRPQHNPEQGKACGKAERKVN
jgi:hypothetical protein